NLAAQGYAGSGVGRDLDLATAKRKQLRISTELRVELREPRRGFFVVRVLFEELEVERERAFEVADPIDGDLRGLVAHRSRAFGIERQTRRFDEELDDSLGVPLFVVNANELVQRPL